jgi:hypothetical protein
VVVNSVAEALARQFDFQCVIDVVGDKLRDVFDAQVLSIIHMIRSVHPLRRFTASSVPSGWALESYRYGRALVRTSSRRASIQAR